MNPKVVVEVLSPLTEAYDRGQKFEFYKTIESLEAYLLIAQDRAHATLYTRQQDDKWVREDVDGADQALRIDALNAELPLSTIYAGIALPTTERGLRQE